jgi:O-antigen/teichoic acid export membrane protein
LAPEPSEPEPSEPEPSERAGRAARIRQHLAEPLFKTAYSLILNSGLNGVLGLAFWALAARRYGPAVVGRNVALIAGLQTLSTFAQLDMAALLLKFLPIWRVGAARAVALCYAVSAGAGLVLGAAFVVVAPAVAPNWGFLRDTPLAVAFCLAVAVWGIFAIEDGALTGLQRAPVVPVENASYGLLKLVLLAGLAGLMPAWGIFGAWILPLVLVIVPVNWLIFRRYLPRHRQRPPPAGPPIDRRTTIRYIGFDYAVGLCGAVTSIGLPLIVLSVEGATLNGYFYIVWTLVLLLDAMSLGMGASLLVEGSYDPGQLAALTRRVAGRLALILGPLVALVVVATPLILDVFGPAYAAHDTAALRLIVVGLLPRGVLSVYTAAARVRGEVERVLAVVLFMTVVLLTLVPVLGRAAGLDGVALAFVIANTLAAAAVALPLHRILHPPPVAAEPQTVDR